MFCCDKFMFSSHASGENRPLFYILRTVSTYNDPGVVVGQNNALVHGLRTPLPKAALKWNRTGKGKGESPKKFKKNLFRRGEDRKPQR